MKRPRPLGDWLSLQQYADYYGVHRNTVAKWRAAGLLVDWTTQHTVRVKRQPPFAAKPTSPDERREPQ